jgi:hypothetical protein
MLHNRFTESIAESLRPFVFGIGHEGVNFAGLYAFRPRL